MIEIEVLVVVIGAQESETIALRPPLPAIVVAPDTPTEALVTGDDDLHLFVGQELAHGPGLAVHMAVESPAIPGLPYGINCVRPQPDIDGNESRHKKNNLEPPPPRLHSFFRSAASS